MARRGQDGIGDAYNRPAQTREALIDATLQSLETSMESAVTLDEIARAAGVTTGAIYAHFGSRQALVLAAYLTHVRNGEQVAREARNRGESQLGPDYYDSDQYAAVVDGLFTSEAMEGQRLFAQALIASYQAGERREQIQQTLRNIVRDWSADVAVQQEQGIMRSDLEPAAFATTLLALSLGYGIVVDALEMDDPEHASIKQAWRAVVTALRTTA